MYIFLVTQPAGFSGAVGILDMQAQHDIKTMLAKKQIGWMNDPNSEQVKYILCVFVYWFFCWVFFCTGNTQW